MIDEPIYPELACTDPLEPRVLPASGFWTLHHACPSSGKLRQTVHDREELADALRRCDCFGGDLYMSQGFFSRPLRRAAYLAYATHAFVDLDTYRAEHLKGLTPDQLAGEVVIYCQDNGVPPPSAVYFSGRGLYAKWYWRHPIPRAAAARAVAVNRELVARLREFGADP